MIIDSHCHLLSTEYEDVDKEIKEAIASGVSRIIINGYDVLSSMEAVALSKKYDEVYAAVGIGPENIDNVTESDIEKIKGLTSNKKVVAIGEIGLDYYWTKEKKDDQIKIFKSMLTIAKKSNLPVIVHSRESIKDIYNLLINYNVTGILHCYSGSLEMAKEFVKKGFLIGIGGVVTFKNATKLKEVVKSISLDYITLETDSPYLTPEPFRGKVNNPSKLSYIIKEIAKLKGIKEEDVINKTANNVMAKFDL